MTTYSNVILKSSFNVWTSFLNNAFSFLFKIHGVPNDTQNIILLIENLFLQLMLSKLCVINLGVFIILYVKFQLKLRYKTYVTQPNMQISLSSISLFIFIIYIITMLVTAYYTICFFVSLLYAVQIIKYFSFIQYTFDIIAPYLHRDQAWYFI